MADGSKPGKTPDLQPLVDCFAASERALAAVLAEMGHIPACLDAAAREANAAGMDVRAFELGGAHREIIAAMGMVGHGMAMLMAEHKRLYDMAGSVGIPVPSPKSGGR